MNRKERRAAASSGGVIRTRSFDFPDFRAIYREALDKTGDPFKAFMEVQVRLLLASGVSTRESAEEETAQMVQLLRAQWEGSERSPADYFAGSAAGLLQGLETAFYLMAEMRSKGMSVVGLTKPPEQN